VLTLSFSHAHFLTIDRDNPLLSMVNFVYEEVEGEDGVVMSRYINPVLTLEQGRKVEHKLRTADEVELLCSISQLDYNDELERRNRESVRSWAWLKVSGLTQLVGSELTGPMYMERTATILSALARLEISLENKHRDDDGQLRAIRIEDWKDFVDPVKLLRASLTEFNQQMINLMAVHAEQWTPPPSTLSASQSDTLSAAQSPSEPDSFPPLPHDLTQLPEGSPALERIGPLVPTQPMVDLTPRRDKGKPRAPTPPRQPTPKITLYEELMMTHAALDQESDVEMEDGSDGVELIAAMKESRAEWEAANRSAGQRGSGLSAAHKELVYCTLPEDLGSGEWLNLPENSALNHRTKDPTVTSTGIASTWLRV
jgi:hypothetical protein